MIKHGGDHSNQDPSLHKELYIQVFLLSIFGSDYHIMLPVIDDRDDLPVDDLSVWCAQIIDHGSGQVSTWRRYGLYHVSSKP